MPPPLRLLLLGGLFSSSSHLTLTAAATAHVGANWGDFFSQTPIPTTDSFNLLKNKGVYRIKLFNTKLATLNASYPL
jgi:hypothetical protein